MKTIYLPIKCSEELPPKEETIFISKHESMIVGWYDQNEDIAESDDSILLNPEYWLKPITLPDEKDMEQEFIEYLQIDIIPDKDDPEHYDYSWGRVVWMACYDHIKKLLK